MNSLIVFTGSYLIYLVALIAVLVTVFSEKAVRNKIIALAIFSFIIAFVISLAAGHIYYDTRPFVQQNIVPLIPHEPTNGFPSDHALYSMVAAATVFIYKRKTGWILVILSILIGVARVAAQIHHPEDILGAVAIALVAVFGGWLILKLIARTKIAAILFEHK